jgi:uncharacterized protein (TIGR02266 family)
LDNRRLHTRHKVYRIEVKVASVDSFRASYLRDLSQGGLFVRSRQPLEIGTAVALELHVPNEELPLALSGTVARVEAQGFGVKFNDLDPTAKAKLDKILRRFDPGQGPGTLPVAPQEADLQTQLSEAHGHIEAYEMMLSALRESESEAQIRAQTVESERDLLADAARELTLQVQKFEVERHRMLEASEVMKSRLTAMERELTALRLARATPDPKDGREAALRQQLEAEVVQLKAELEQSDLGHMRRELQELLGQLEDEKLKTMAMQNALERFMSKGPPSK